MQRDPLPRVAFTAVDRASLTGLALWQEHAREDEGLATFLRRAAARAWAASSKTEGPDGFVHSTAFGLTFSFKSEERGPHAVNAYAEEVSRG